MSPRDRQPPQLIGLGPDSTPPGGTDIGTTEQRMLGGVVDIAGKVDALQADTRKTDVILRRLDATVGRMLDGYREVLDVLAAMRATDKSRDEQVGALLAALARVERRLGIVEQGPREGSHPVLDDLARIGVRMAAARAEDEDTQVRERREIAESRQQTRALVLTWARRAALVLGPLLTYLLTKYLGG